LKRKAAESEQHFQKLQQERRSKWCQSSGDILATDRKGLKVQTLLRFCRIPFDLVAMLDELKFDRCIS
jgi:hypothetical protein